MKAFKCYFLSFLVFLASTPGLANGPSYELRVHQGSEQNKDYAISYEVVVEKIKTPDGSSYFRQVNQTYILNKQSNSLEYYSRWTERIDRPPRNHGGSLPGGGSGNGAGGGGGGQGGSGRPGNGDSSGHFDFPKNGEPSNPRYEVTAPDQPILNPNLEPNLECNIETGCMKIDPYSQYGQEVITQNRGMIASKVQNKKPNAKKANDQNLAKFFNVSSGSGLDQLGFLNSSYPIKVPSSEEIAVSEALERNLVTQKQLLAREGARYQAQVQEQKAVMAQIQSIFKHQAEQIAAINKFKDQKSLELYLTLHQIIENGKNRVPLAPLEKKPDPKRIVFLNQSDEVALDKAQRALQLVNQGAIAEAAELITQVFATSEHQEAQALLKDLVDEAGFLKGEAFSENALRVSENHSYEFRRAGNLLQASTTIPESSLDFENKTQLLMAGMMLVRTSKLEEEWGLTDRMEPYLDVAQTIGEFLLGTGEGFARSVKDTLLAIPELGKLGYHAGKTLWEAYQQDEKLAYELLITTTQNLAKALPGAIKQVWDESLDTIQNGSAEERGKLFGSLSFEVLTFVGVGGIFKNGKRLEQIADVGADTGKALKTSKVVAKADVDLPESVLVKKADDLIASKHTDTITDVGRKNSAPIPEVLIKKADDLPAPQVTAKQIPHTPLTNGAADLGHAAENAISPAAFKTVENLKYSMGHEGVEAVVEGLKYSRTNSDHIGKVARASHPLPSSGDVSKDLRQAIELAAAKNLPVGLTPQERRAFGAASKQFLNTPQGFEHYQLAIDLVGSRFDNTDDYIYFFEQLQRAQSIPNFLRTAKELDIQSARGMLTYARLFPAIETMPKGLKPVRMFEGQNPNKVAIIGRSMNGVVRDAYKHFGEQGIDVDIFDRTDLIEEFFESRKAYNKTKYGIPDTDTNSPLLKEDLPDHVVVNQRIFEENIKWLDKKAIEGYTILDFGNPNNLNMLSVFYEAETYFLFKTPWQLEIPIPTILQK